MRRASLHVHIETVESMPLDTLMGSLGGLARQYELFAQRQGFIGKSTEAKLLVSSVSRGSIDISLFPDVVSAGALLAPVVNELEIIRKFADHVKWLLSLFMSRPETGEDVEQLVSVKDCDDVIRIVKPVAENGGVINLNVFNGDVHQNIISTTTSEARRATEKAARTKARLQVPSAETRQNVAMVWTRLDKSRAKTTGQSSLDKAKIEEIDSIPKSIFFNDELAYLKEEMIGDEENPYQKVYYVDAQVVTAEGKIVAYRIVGYHGKEDLA